MLWLLAHNPMLWLYPALVVLVLWIAVARLVRFKGEASFLGDPGIIVCGSALWFIVVPFALIGGAIIGLSVLVGLLIGKKDE